MGEVAEAHLTRHMAELAGREGWQSGQDVEGVGLVSICDGISGNLRELVGGRRHIVAIWRR